MQNSNTKTALRTLGHCALGVLVCSIGTLAQAAVPGITGGGAAGNVFHLVASEGATSQPDGRSVYTWGYGCDETVDAGRFVPDGIPGTCIAMQNPGPTLVVTQGDTVTVTLRNNLPPAAGSTSILFPGFAVSSAVPAGGGCRGNNVGLLTIEAKNGCTVEYSFTAPRPGTYAYYSGTRGDVQIEMGLFGAIIVRPAAVPTGCVAVGSKPPTFATEADFRLAASAYDHPSTCYDREYLFQLSEIDPDIHMQVQEQVAADGGTCTRAEGCLSVLTEPYQPAYFMVNGRSFPDSAEPNYGPHYLSQPYNGNPHMHPGELTLIRLIGTGRWQHPLHEHGNHLRVLARDGHLLLTQPATPGGPTQLAGPLVFTTTSVPGQSEDSIYQWTGKGLNWDAYGHTDAKAVAAATCIPDSNGYYTVGTVAAPARLARNYWEWCGDHNKPLESKPFGDVGSGGPVTLPDPTLFAMGPWYSGSPYLTADATARSMGATPIPPSGTVGNTTGSFSYMWHSHNEREITTNNAFPGGMMMMMLVDPWDAPIDERK